MSSLSPLEMEKRFPLAGSSHAPAPAASQAMQLRAAALTALPAPAVPCPVPLMTLLCSWPAAAADAAIVSLTIIQILDLLVTETFFFLSS